MVNAAQKHLSSAEVLIAGMAVDYGRHAQGLAPDRFRDKLKVCGDLSLDTCKGTPSRRHA
jgi:hypothetical protein